MKNSKNILLSLGLAFLSMACADLEEKPVGVFAPETFFNTPKDVETAVLGSYGVLASEPLFGRQFNSALMLRSDMVDIGNRATSAERIQVNDFNMDSNNGMVGRFWPVWFQVINAANAAESGGENLGLQPEEINPLIAEAKFVRAFSYFHLVRVFGELPYINFAVSDPSALKTISKTSEAEIYAGIIADLEFAKQWLPSKQKNDVRTRPTAGTAASYLASVYLTLGNYQKAYDESKFVIDNKDRFGYRLEADFRSLWIAANADNVKETIFAMDFLGQVNVGSQNDDLIPNMTGVINFQPGTFGVNVPSLRVYNTWDNRDYRKEVSLVDTIVFNGVARPFTQFTTPRPHIYKWTQSPGNSNVGGRFSDHNYIDMRYAEVLLIAAEAGAEVGKPDTEIAGYLNQVRERARNWGGRITDFPVNVAPGLANADYIAVAMDDRRLELAFEWKRWYDIKRRRLGETVFSGPNSLEPRFNFDPTRDYLFPLPNSELLINPNLGPNNPGY
jgi:hypothetical protein